MESTEAPPAIRTVPLDEKSSRKLKELQTARPDLQTIALRPGALFLVEGGQVKVLSEPGGAPASAGAAGVPVEPAAA